MAEQFTTIRAPYPSPKVTMHLPKADFRDSRAPQTDILVKRSMLGRTITYVKSNSWETLFLPFRLTRQKSLEVEAFVNSYQSASWEVTIYDGSRWECKLPGRPLTRTAVDRFGGSKPALTGEELIELTFEFSARRLN